MNIEERLQRLEELYDPMYHKMDMLERYIPKLISFLTKYMRAITIFGSATEDRVNLLARLSHLTDQELREHFKSHFVDKKKREQYASKRRPLTNNNILTNIYKGRGGV